MNKIKYITFDFFGTLVGYKAGHLSGEECLECHKYLTDKGYIISYDKFTTSFFEAFEKLEANAKLTNKEFHMNDVVKLFYKNNFKKVSEKEVEEFVGIYMDKWGRSIKHFPEIKKFLAHLKKNYSLSIISNTHFETLVPKNLELMGVKEYFNNIVLSVEYGIRKPDPRIFNKALKDLSAVANNTIHIGDNYNDDYLGAANAGIRCILIDPDNKWNVPVTNRVNNLFEIESLI